MQVVVRDGAVASALGAFVRSLPNLRVLLVVSNRRDEAMKFFCALTQTPQQGGPSGDTHKPACCLNLRELDSGCVSTGQLEVISRITSLESLTFELSILHALFSPSALRTLSSLTQLRHIAIISTCVVRGLEDVLPHLRHLQSLSVYDLDSCAQLSALPPSVQSVKLHKVSSSCLCGYIGTLARLSLPALHRLHVDRLILCLGSEHRGVRALAEATASHLAAAPHLDVTVAQLYGLSGMAQSLGEYLEPLPQIASRLTEVCAIPSAMMTWEV